MLVIGFTQVQTTYNICTRFDFSLYHIIFRIISYLHSLYLFVCRFIWWDNCLKRSLSGTNSEDNGWWSDDVPVLGPVLDAGVGLQTIGSFKSFVTILAHVARAGQVCLHMLLHVLLGSVTVATMDANKLSVHSPLKHGMYLLFIRAWIPSWKYTSLLRFVKIETNGKWFYWQINFHIY